MSEALQRADGAEGAEGAEDESWLSLLTGVVVRVVPMGTLRPLMLHVGHHSPDLTSSMEDHHECPLESSRIRGSCLESIACNCLDCSGLGDGATSLLAGPSPRRRRVHLALHDRGVVAQILASRIRTEPSPDAYALGPARSSHQARPFPHTHSINLGAASNQIQGWQRSC